MNTSLSEAIREAYATSPTDDPELHTLEIYHPLANGGVSRFLVRDLQDRVLKIEGGVDKTFQKSAFRFVLPKSGANGGQNLQLAIDNTDRQIGDFFEAVKDSATAVLVTYRPYLASDPDTPQYNPPLVLTLRDVVIANEVTGNAVCHDVVNKKFPNDLYTRKRFRGLANL